VTKEELGNFRSVFFDILRNYSINKEQLIAIESKTSSGDVIDILNSDRDSVMNLKLIGRERFFIKKVMDALVRIENRTFGVCSDCGGDIELGRLKARPTATQCISCKEDQERVEDTIVYQKKSHTLGKQLNSGVIQVKLSEDDYNESNPSDFNTSLNVLMSPRS